MNRPALEAGALVLGMMLLAVLVVVVLHWNGHAVVFDHTTDLPTEEAIPARHHPARSV